MEKIPNSRINDHVALCSKKMCGQCKYSGRFTGGMPETNGYHCDYLGITGHRRPDSPTAECIARDTGKSRRRTAVNVGKPHHIKCKLCGRLFWGHPGASYCLGCYDTAKEMAAQRTRQRKRGYQDLPEIQCVVCGATFKPSRRDTKRCEECRIHNRQWSPEKGEERTMTESMRVIHDVLVAVAPFALIAFAFYVIGYGIGQSNGFADGFDRGMEYGKMAKEDNDDDEM